MIIQIEKNISDEQLSSLQSLLKNNGYQGTEVSTSRARYLVCNGKKDIDLRIIGHLPYVVDIHKVSDAYKLVSSKWRTSPSVIDLGNDVMIGNGNFQLMAGPCSIESEEQVLDTIQHLLKNGIRIMRGGVFKPRSSPYSFRGMGMDGLRMFYKLCSEHGIKIITEVMQVSEVEEMLPYVDIFQVGTRNAQNFNLLDALGKAGKTVMLKRGFSGTIDEQLLAAEYIFSNGNENIILCERGIRTFEQAYRNTLDLNAVAILKEKTHLPVVVDPSHGIGIRKHVATMALAGVIAGADGIIVEVHNEPEKAMSDGQQTLSYAEAEKLYRNIETVLKAKEQLV